MPLSRTLLLGACLALPAVLGGSAMAQPADRTQVIQVPPGAIVLILGGSPARTAPMTVSTEPAADSTILRFIAQQDAMMQRMMADMDALFPPMPDPAQIIRATMQAAQGARAEITTTSIAGGQGICGESISYTFNGNGTRPMVHVTRYGDACGSASPGGAQEITAPHPVQPSPARQPKVLEVSYPPRPVHVGTPPRT